MLSEAEQSALAGLIHEGTLLADVACMKCRYNLRGLSPASRCPECGHPLSESLIKHVRRVVLRRPLPRHCSYTGLAVAGIGLAATVAFDGLLAINGLSASDLWGLVGVVELYAGMAGAKPSAVAFARAGFWLTNVLVIVSLFGASYSLALLLAGMTRRDHRSAISAGLAFVVTCIYGWMAVRHGLAIIGRG
jgi:hypothetical protein